MTVSQIIKQVDALKQALDALRPIKPDQEQRIMQKLRLEWTYHSNAIEGNTLTFGETKAFLLHGITAQGKPFRDYLDIEGHAEAIEYLQEFIRREEILTEAAIRELHKIILVRPYEVDAVTQDGRSTKRTIQPGQYKSMPNHVKTSSGDIHYYASPEDTPILMSELVAWYQDALAKGEIHPLILAATFHYRFVAIHPFDDGNGRMARLLMNLILMQAGYVPTIVQTGTKNEYLLALEKADEDDDLSDFIILVGTELKRSLELCVRGAKGETVDAPNDLDKQVAILRKKMAAQQSVKGPEKSPDWLSHLYKEAIKPLLNNLFSQLQKFDALFTQSNFLSTFHSEGFRKATSSQLQEALQLLPEFFQGPDMVTVLKFHYSWHGLPTDKNFSLPLHIEFTFQQFKFATDYTISNKRRNLLEKERYDTILTEDEIFRSAKYVTYEILAIIEKQTSK